MSAKESLVGETNESGRLAENEFIGWQHPLLIEN